MKRMILLAFVLLAAFCCVSLASAEDGEYWVDLPDQFTIEVGGYFSAYYGCPTGGPSITVSCSDPEAFQSLGTGSSTRGPYFYGQMLKLGQYTLSYASASGFLKEVQVSVEPVATAIHMEQDLFIVEVGQTVPVRYTLEGGVLRNPFRNYNSNALSFDLQGGESTTLTGLKTGRSSMKPCPAMPASTWYPSSTGRS